MDLKSLQRRASEIREKYAKMELQKYGKSWTNTQIMQGFVGDVGDLMKIIMAKEGVREITDVDKKLAHELSDCLWSVLVLAEKYGIDLESEFLVTMDELDEKIETS